MSGPSKVKRSTWHVERRGTDFAPWSIVHTPSGLTVPVWRPYPGQENLPPIQVANFRSRVEAERAADEIDWAEVDRITDTDEGRKVAREAQEKREFDAAYQRALAEARAGREPYPWQTGGLLHRLPDSEVIELGQLTFDTISQDSVKERAA